MDGDLAGRGAIRGTERRFLVCHTAEKIISNERYVSEAARAIGSRMLESLIRVAIILSSGTSVLAMLMAGPRVYCADGSRWFST